MADKKVLVTCSKVGRIPWLGMGPIKNPVYLDESKVESLINQGFPIYVFEGSEAGKSGSKEEQTVETSETLVKEPVDPPADKEPSEPADPPADKESADDQQKIADTQDFEKFDKDGDHLYDEKELKAMKADDIRAMLTAAEIAFDERATKPELIKLVLDAQEATE